MEMIHIMTKHPETIHPDDTLARAHEMMEVGGFRRLPVVNNGALVGMLTERDLRQHRGHLASTKVNATMSTPVLSVAPASTVQEAARLMLQRKIGGLPVVERGMVVGIVTTSDMLQAFLEVIEGFADTHPSAPRKG